jgi:hypothetical protein
LLLLLELELDPDLLDDEDDDFPLEEEPPPFPPPPELPPEEPPPPLAITRVARKSNEMRKRKRILVCEWLLWSCCL